MARGLHSGVDPQRCKTQTRPLLGPLHRVFLRLGAPTQTFNGHIRFAIAEHHQQGRHASALQSQGLFAGVFQSQGDGCAAATRQTSQGFFSAHQGARGGQQGLHLRAPKRDDADTVTPRIGLLQQQIHRAFGLSQTCQCG